MWSVWRACVRACVYGVQNLVTVDLVAKQMVNQVKLKATKEYTILAPIAC